MKRFVQTLSLLMAIVGIAFLSGCGSNRDHKGKLNNQDIGNLVGEMSELMLHDVTSPPLAARFFGYTFLSGYEILSAHDSAYKRFTGRLNNYPVLDKPGSTKVPDSIQGYEY